MNITFTPGGPTEIRVLTMAIINRVYDGLSIITGAYILSGVIQGGVIVIAEPGNWIIGYFMSYIIFS